MPWRSSLLPHRDPPVLAGKRWGNDSNGRVGQVDKGTDWPPKEIINQNCFSILIRLQGLPCLHGFQKNRIRDKSKKWSLWKSSQVGKEDGLDSETFEPRHLVMASATSAATAEAPFITARAAAAVSIQNDASHLTYQAIREAWAAAVAIQTAFRGFLARRALRALKGLVRLQALVRGHIVRTQTAAAFYSMQALIRVQARACAYRVHISSEGQTARQKAKERHKSGSQLQESEQGWCDAIGTIEEMQAKVQQRQEATIKRERALAYAFHNQRRANCKADLQDVDDHGDKWSWLWLQKGMGMESSMSHAVDQGSTNSIDIPRKKIPASMSQNVKRSSQLSFDASKDIVKSLTRGGSHGNLLLANTLDGHSDASYSPSRKNLQKTRYGASEFPVKAPERRAFSNPKQRPQSEEAQGKRKASVSVQKSQYFSHNR